MTEKRITDSEWEVMVVLWREGKLRSADIIKALVGIKEWHPKTIHTLIARLVKKGVVNVLKEGKHNYYEAAIDEQEWKSTETQSFVDKVYEGSAKKMLLNFIEENNLSKDDVEDLRAILDKKQK